MGDTGYIMGGNIKFPKLQAAPATSTPSGVRSNVAVMTPTTATQRLPKRLGWLRQAKIEDLSDLLRPGVAHPRDNNAGRGSAEGGGLAPRLTPAEQHDHSNAAVAVQRMLNKRLKFNVRERFPSAQGAMVARGAWAPRRPSLQAGDSRPAERLRQPRGVLDL